MENLFAALLKLATIFIGSGLFFLLAFYIAREVSTIPRLIIASNSKEKSLEKWKIKLGKIEKLSPDSGIYEVLLPDSKVVKLLSSNKGMKILS